MHVNKILLNYTPQIAPTPVAAHSKPKAAPYSYETSIYNNKGVTIPFQGVATGIDAIETACIKYLKSRRASVRRVYTEQDIMDSLLLMRGAKNDRNKQEVLEQIVEISQTVNGINPDQKFIHNILKVTRDRDDREYYAVMNFAQNELEELSVAPLQALADAPKEFQDKFVRLLVRIDDVNDTRNFTTSEAREKHIGSLYTYMRTLMYTQDDLPKRNAEEMLNNISDLTFDIRRMKENAKGFSSNKAHSTVVNVAEGIRQNLINTIANSWERLSF